MDERIAQYWQLEKKKADQEENRKHLQSDLTVAGAGIAGICAAIAAAREGLSVILVNDRSVLGGNASSEIGVSINGASHLGLNASIYARETGIVEEIRLRMLRYNEGGGYSRLALMDAVLFDMIYEEKNITLLLNTWIYGCEKENGKILCCFGRHGINNQLYELKSSFYIDATGNGVLAYEAGASFRMGREGREEFGERKAPIKADAMTMGNTFYFETEDCGKEVKYIPPAFAREVSCAEFLKNINKPGNHRALSVKGAHWSFEYGGQEDCIKDSEDVDKELRRLVFGIWDYIKNSGKYPEAKNYVLKRVYTRSGMRESRRFIGDYILTENDIEEKRNFPDSVCVGGWPMDVHTPFGIYDPGPATEFIPVTGLYNIPFRCLYSKDVDNLLLAGRDASFTHIALGSTRVMATCGSMGQAAGIAVKCCKDFDVLPGKLGEKYMGELQERLAGTDQTICGHEEHSLSEKGFTAQASCSKQFENSEVNGKAILDRVYGLALMLETEHIDRLELWVENCSGEDTCLSYEILEGIHKETFLPQRQVKKGTQLVKAGHCGWLPLEVDAGKGEDGKLYLALGKNPDLAVGMTRQSLPGAVTLRLYPKSACQECNHDSVPLNPESGYLYLDHRYNHEENLAFRNVVPRQQVFSPKMLLNPYTRPYGMPNLWIGKGSYPWFLTLKADKPVLAGKLSIIFDTDLTKEPLPALPGCLVKDFDVKVQFEEGSLEIKIRDNYKRQVIIPLTQDPGSAKGKENGVTQIELTILESYGEAAGIYSVNLW